VADLDLIRSTHQTITELGHEHGKGDQ